MATDTVKAAAEGDPDPRRYRQVAHVIRDLIMSGQIAQGQPTPTITQLVARYGTARATSAKALRLLEEEGLLTRWPGLGYYVSGPGPE